MAKGERVIELTDGPWTGMLDAPRESVSVAGKYRYAVNLYPEDPTIGSGMVSRPGIQALGGTTALGGGGAFAVQGIATFTRLGTPHTVVVAGGKFFTYDWTGDTFTEGPTTATLTGVGVTINAGTAHVALLPTRLGLVVSDGVNTPWLWTGVSVLAGSITKLTNAPAFLGRPAYRLGRLFGIVQTDQTKLVWSETDDFTTGYEAGGFNNAWVVTQSNGDPLTAIAADNDGLTLFRARSTTRVYGDDPSGFVTGNTLDTMDETKGTTAPFAIVRVGLNLLVLDADMRPHLARPSGSGFTPLYSGCAETIKQAVAGAGIPVADLAGYSSAVLHATLGLVLIVLPLGGTPYQQLLVYDVRGRAPEPIGVWTFTGVQITQVGVVGDVLLLGTTGGRVYKLLSPDAGGWNDIGWSGAAVPIPHGFHTMALGYSTNSVKIFDRLTLTGNEGAGDVTLDIELIAPEQPQLFTMTLPDIGSVEGRREVGVDAKGRWVWVYIGHEELGKPFSLETVTVTGVVAGKEPPTQ